MNDVMLIVLNDSTTTSWLDQFNSWARIDTPFQMAVVVFGVFAQVLFFCRWLVQWIASERRGVSHMPMMFWWLSLIGASMLLTYYILRREPVGILGQGIGWIVYARNMVLIRAQKSAVRMSESNDT
ncbi:MAG: lipid-A-disaccharide synthase N-terminal domain-containing protein [Planctomycetota bacterium]